MQIDIDDFDLFILMEIYNSYKTKIDCNTWNIAKKYNSLIGKNGFYDINKCYKNVKTRMKKFVNWGIITPIKNGSNKITYFLLFDNFKIRKHKIIKKDVDCLFLRILGKWIILEK